MPYGGIHMNNNIHTEQALRDVFGTSNYITIQDDYNKKTKADPRYQGKQLSHAPPKVGKTNETLFQGAYLWLYEKEKYKDSAGYRETQPLDDRKTGFLSHDAKRRDEFTLHTRVEQYREQLRKEDKFAKVFHETMKTKAAKAGKMVEDKRKATMTAKERRTAASAGKNLTDFEAPDYLFDLGRPEGTTQYCMKCPRDTFFCKHTAADFDRRFGDFKLASQTIGWGSEDMKNEKSQFSRMPIIRDSFFRRTGVLARD